jgi:signal peptide peptidase SppA
VKILDIMNRPLAILDTKLQSIHEIHERYAAGEKFDAAGFKIALGGQKAEADPGYTIDNGVAIIPIEGVIAKRMNLFTYFSGGISTQILQQTIDAVAKDETVHSVIISIDSPGGEVDGTQLAADAIAELGKTKPVVAYLDGLAASAAYWLASQAGEIFMADMTTVVGSIGVVAMHVDQSRANDQAGKKVTEITAGKYKRIASSHSPLSHEGQATIQDQVDQIYSVFLNAVATGRGVGVDAVHADMADGKIFIGQQAIDAGLVDGISSLDAIITQLNTDFQQQQQDPGATRPAHRFPGAKSMFKTFATEAEYTAAMSAEFERGKASAPTTSAAELDRIKAEAQTAGATAERARIQAVEDAALSGHSALINTLKFDGKTTGAEAALAVVAAERRVRGDKGAALEADAGNGVGASVVDPGADAATIAAAAAEAAGAANEDPNAMSVKLKAHVAAAAKDGRKISLSQASAELNKK